MDRKAYQRKARKCILLADEVEDPAVRLKMLAIAQRYLVLASAEKRAGLGIENDTYPAEQTWAAYIGSPSAAATSMTTQTALSWPMTRPRGTKRC
jgi:hypothetical protein